MNGIRAEIGDSNIWLCVDETTDAAGRYIANAIVGTLSENGPTTPHVIASYQLEKTNKETVARFVDDALSSLYGGPIPKERVLLLLSDAVPYMKAAGRALKVFYPNLTHMTCLAHALHRVCEVIRNSCPEVNKLVAAVKKVFEKAPLRVQYYKEQCNNMQLPPAPVITRWGTWIDAVAFYAQHWNEIERVVKHFSADDAECIAKSQKLLSSPTVHRQVTYIAANYLFLSDSIKKLETQGLSLSEQLQIIYEAETKIQAVRGSIAPQVAVKLQYVLQNNGGYKILGSICNIIDDSASDEDTTIVKDNLPNLNPTDLGKFKFAPATSCKVERS